uniref:Cytochrome b561 domain-containing protein n=1 Tax=Strongyloides stercoralis TaxID=6248 RepID=A0A0K0E8T1_STRER
MYGKIYTILFGLCCLINLIICGLLIFIITKTINNTHKPDWALILSFFIFIILTILLIIAFIFWRKLRKDFLLILCITFTIGQCLCLIVTGIAFFVNETYPSKYVSFIKNPYTWLEFHRFTSLLIVIFLLPIYLCQIFIINRYGGREYLTVPTTEISGKDLIVRKNTPYNNSQKKIEKSYF